MDITLIFGLEACFVFFVPVGRCTRPFTARSVGLFDGIYCCMGQQRLTLERNEHEHTSGGTMAPWYVAMLGQLVVIVTILVFLWTRFAIYVR